MAGYDVAGFAERLRAAIGTTPKAHVAAQAGLAREHLFRLLRGVGKHGPYPQTASALARVTGVRFAWLATGEGAIRDG